MRFFTNPFWRATFFLSGMIIGVGIYGIPYVFSRAGFVLGSLELLILTIVITGIHLVYGEIVLRTREWHRLPGYAGIYLGSFAKKISIVSYLISFSGALASYVFLGGHFLSNLISPDMAWTYAFFFFGAFLLFFSVRLSSRIDTAIIILIVLFIAGLFFYSIPHINSANLSGFDASEWFFPYGILMFALAGMAAIPDMAGFLEHDPKLLRKAIITGSVLPAVLYFLFALAVVGVSGSGTTKEAMLGISQVLGGNILFFGSIIGILSTFNGFIILGSVLKGMMHLDLGFGWRMSWFLTVLIPFLFIFSGMSDYLAIIGFVGSFSIALDGVMTLLIYRKAVLNGNRPSEYSMHIHGLFLLVIGVLFLAGFAHQFL